MLRPKSEWEEFSEHRKNKGLLITALVTIGFFILVLRLWHLQIVEHATLSNRAENNRIRQVTLDGRRGKIFDRNNLALVDSRPSFQLALIREDVEDLEGTLRYLNRRMDFNFEETLEKARKSRKFKPVIIKRDIGREDVAFVEEHRLDLPGVYLRIQPTRNYIYEGLAAHLLGYLGAITTKQLAKAPESTYSMDDFVGQNGIEKEFEETLRGSKGLKRVEVDAAGRELALLGVIEPRSGKSLRLTIDYDAQQAAEKAFEGKNGAAMALDPNTGEVLAFISKPSFDPHTFAHGISTRNWK